MDELWRFSRISEPLLKRLTEVTQFDETNKWTKVFKRKSPDYAVGIVEAVDTDNDKTTDAIKIQKKEHLPAPADVNDDNTENNNFLGEDIKQICEVIESDLPTRLELIIEKSSKSSELLTAIANKVSDSSIEKFCKLIYDSSSDLPKNFITGYFKVFLPEFLRKKQVWFSLDILVRGFKTFPCEFHNILIPIILNNTNIPKNILHDFILTLTAKEKTDLLNAVCETRLESTGFAYHISSIYELYKDGEHNPSIQSFILSSIEESSGLCTNDKNYGRLLLLFIQSTSKFPVNLKLLENSVENHRSAFKRLCLSKLKELKEQQ